VELESAFQKTFTIYPRHLEYLKKLDDDNISNALREILDYSMQKQSRNDKILFWERIITWMCFGAIFMFIGFLLIFPLNILSSALGLMLFTFGFIRGVLCHTANQ
jgi:hypothetical protein